MEEQDKSFQRMLEQSQQKHKSNASTIRIIRPVFEPLFIDNRATVANKLLGQQRAAQLWNFLRNPTWPLLVILTLVGIIVFVATLLGKIESQWVYICLPGSVPMFCNLLFMNVTKLKLLIRCFLPMYLLCASLTLCVGLALTIRDERALMIVQLFPALLSTCFFDALHSSIRKKYGAIIYTSNLWVSIVNI